MEINLATLTIETVSESNGRQSRASLVFYISLRFGKMACTASAKTASFMDEINRQKLGPKHIEVPKCSNSLI